LANPSKFGRKPVSVKFDMGWSFVRRIHVSAAMALAATIIVPGEKGIASSTGEIERDADLRDDNFVRGIPENTYFQQFPAGTAHAPDQTPTAATPRNGQAVHGYVSQPGHGT
jgi:hypothetical protein